MKHFKFIIALSLIVFALSCVPPFPPHLPPANPLPQSYEINPRRMFAPAPAHHEKEAQSFMFTRPIYRNIAAQQTAWHDFIYEKEGCIATSIQAIVFHQQSLHLQNVARYFMIHCQNNLIVRGDAAPESEIRDIRAEWINLPSTFNGTMSLNPKQKQCALWIECAQDVGKIISHPFFENFWISIALPIQFVENDIHLHQNIISTQIIPDKPSTLVEAFNQPDWLFSKIRPTSKKKFGIAEIMFKLGSVFLNRDGFQIGVYTVFIAPTAGPQKASYLFNPFLANNRHFAFGTGVNFQFPLNCQKEGYLASFFFNAENLFFIRNWQHRTFNLKNNPWSRYLLYNSLDGRKNIPGVNIFTRKVKVQPFNMADISAGFRIQTDLLEFEAGYSVWLHGDEQLRMEDGFFPAHYGIAGDGANVPGTNIGATASNSTIKNQAANDTLNNEPTFIAIRQRDIDFLSASMRAAVVHRWHLAGNLILETKKIAAFIGVGGYFETPQENTALRTWGLWAKAGMNI